MKNFLLIFITIFFINNSAFSAGTRDQASALLERGIALIQIDKNRALEQFVSGNGGLVIEDLYVFCFVTEGTLTAHPALLGYNILSNPDIKDENGVQLGVSMISNAKSGVISEVVYKLRKYDTDSEQEYTKTTLYTKVSDQICGVGYYSD